MIYLYINYLMLRFIVKDLNWVWMLLVLLIIYNGLLVLYVGKELM